MKIKFKFKKFYIFIALAAFALSYVIAAVINSFMKLDVFRFNAKVVFSLDTLGIAGVIFLLFSLFVVFSLIDWKQKNYASKQLDTTKKAKSDLYGSAEFQSDAQFNENYKRYSFDELAITDNTCGWLVRSKFDKGKMYFNILQNRHFLGCGTNRSGKSAYVISPNIQIFSASKEKASFVVTDPKAELFNTHSKRLKEDGYEVKVFNIRTPRGDPSLGISPSIRYNPLMIIYENYHKYLNLKQQGKEQEAGYFLDKASEYTREIAETMFPIENKNDKTWDEGSQNLVSGLIWAMLEDSADTKYKITPEKFTLWQLQNLLTQDFEDLKDFCNGRPATSLSRKFTSHVINNKSEKTRDSWLSNTVNKLGKFVDSGISYLTSNSDIDFGVCVDKPTAVFLVIADEVKSRHFIAVILICQLYNVLIQRASLSPSGKLPRAFYFFLDEFGNLPKIPNMQEKLAISGGRNIWFMLMLQEMAQLSSVYGDTDAQIISGNCHLQMFIGGVEKKTLDHFSDQMSTQTVFNHSLNSNNKDFGVASGSTSLVKRSLVLPDELSRTKSGNVYFKCYQHDPCKSYFVPIFEENRGFKLGKLNADDIKYYPLNEKALYFDLRKRNAACADGAQAVVVNVVQDYSSSEANTEVVEPAKKQKAPDEPITDNVLIMDTKNLIRNILSSVDEKESVIESIVNTFEKGQIKKTVQLIEFIMDDLSGKGKAVEDLKVLKDHIQDSFVL